MAEFGISMPLPDLSEERLRFLRQIGVEAVTIPARYSTEPIEPSGHLLVPPAQKSPAEILPLSWSEKELCRICERVRAFDLEPMSINLRISGSIVLGSPQRDADLQATVAAIQAAGRSGIGVATYTFTALRASEGYALRERGGRGAAGLRDFDYERIRNLPALPSVGVHSEADMWDRLTQFLQTAVPAAEKAGVRLAARPNDPPVPVYREVAQPLVDFESMKRLIDVVDSPANCIFYDTGVSTEWGEDAEEVLRYFGSRQRIAAVHFRNVIVDEPRFRYLETFVDEGECDMAACMAALVDVGYDGWLDPDHSPGSLATAQTCASATPTPSATSAPSEPVSDWSPTESGFAH